jgi:uncharacterized protein YecT (DUF1311 family)
MLNSLRLATAFLLFAILLSAQNTNPAKQSTSQKSPCDWAQTQQEMNQCSGEQYRKADARLNTLYAKLIGLMEKDIAAAKQENDAEEKNYNEAAIQKLRAAEKAWIQYRDLHCDAARYQIGGGSMSPMVWADCMASTTEHRIEDLKNAYESGDRKLE